MQRIHAAIIEPADGRDSASRCRATSSRCWRHRPRSCRPTATAGRYRDQVGRDPRPRLRRRGRRAARRPARDRPHAPLPGAGGDRRRPRRPRGDPRRRDRRLRRGRTAELPAAAAADGPHHRVDDPPRAAETPATYVAFDLLWLDGRSLLAEPYERRRELLAGLGFDGPSWQAPAHHVGDGARLWEAVASAGLEGIVAKRLRARTGPGSAAASGSRSATAAARSS